MISLLTLIMILSGIPSTNVNVYAQTFAVVEVDRDLDVVTCIDPSGEEWAFDCVVNPDTGREWKRGDMVSAIMTDNGTSDIHDDEFITITCNGEIHGGFGWDSEYCLPLVEF